MAEAKTITTQKPKTSKESSLSSTNATAETSVATLVNKVGDCDGASSQKSMSLQTSSDETKGLEVSHSSSLTTSTEILVDIPSKDDLESSPRALANLVLAAASDLLEVSPRSMEMETPTSLAGTPNSNRAENGSKSATTSTTPEQPEEATYTKPKGILKKKTRYSVSVSILIDGGSDTSPTTGNTIHNINQFRKSRKHNNDFDFFDLSDIDRLVDKDDDDSYNSESSGNTTLMSILWSLVGLPLILLGYGGLPYLVFATLVWTLIFVARWFRRFLVEEFSMRRNNGSLNEATRQVPIKYSSNSATNLSGILASISPIAGARKTRVRFPEGIKFPERKLLRQPIPRIQKPSKNTPGKNHKKPYSLFLGDEENNEGDTWSLDSLMVLRNYMKDTNNNTTNSIDPTPMSVLAPPPPYPPSLTKEEIAIKEEKATTIIAAPLECDLSSGDEADDKCTALTSFLDEDAAENDVVLDFSSSISRRRRDSVMFFPQEFIEEEDTAYESRYGHSVQPSIQLDDDDDEPIDHFFHEGLFGKPDSASPTTISNSKLRRRSSRYRRRKPRDSLCFTYLKKIVVIECPTIPQCPSDELEFLEQKKQEKFEQSIIIQHHQHQEPTQNTTTAPILSYNENIVPTAAILGNASIPLLVAALDAVDAKHTHRSSPKIIDSEEASGDDHENEDNGESSYTRNHESSEEHEPDITTSSLTTGCWDETKITQNSELLPSGLSIDDNENYPEIGFSNDADVEQHKDDSPLSVVDPELDMPGIDDFSELDEEIRTAMRDTEEILASFVEMNNTPSPQCSVVSDKEEEEPQYINQEDYPVDVEGTLGNTHDGSESEACVQKISIDLMSSGDEDELPCSDSLELPVGRESTSTSVIKDDDSAQSSKASEEITFLDNTEDTQFANKGEVSGMEDSPIANDLQSPFENKEQERTSLGHIDDVSPSMESEETIADEGEASLTDHLPMMRGLRFPFENEEDEKSIFGNIEDASPSMILEETFADEGVTTMRDDLPMINDLQSPKITDEKEPVLLDETVIVDEGETSITGDLPIINDLQPPLVEEETTSNSGNAQSPQLSCGLDILSVDEEDIAMTRTVTKLREPKEAGMSTADDAQIINSENIETPPLDVSLKLSATDAETTLMTDSALGLTNLGELTTDKGYYSTIIDEALQKSDSKELPILEKGIPITNDDFPEFNVMQEISFDDESDDVECILSPHAFKFEQEDTTCWDRNPVIHVPFAKINTSKSNGSNKELLTGSIVNKILTIPSNLQIEMAVTNEDLECILSPAPTDETEPSLFDKNGIGEIERLALSSPKSPMNKENLDEKIVFGGTHKDEFYLNTSDHTKALDEINLSWSTAFPRTVLSPTNQRPTRS